MRFTVLLLAVFLVVSSLSGTAVAQSDSESVEVPQEIQNILDQEPTEVTVEQLEQVQTWFSENGEQLPEERYNEIGQWIGQATTADLESEDDPVQTVDTEPESVEIEINDNLRINEYTFDDNSVTVTITAQRATEQVVMTDPHSVDGSSGSGRVSQQGVTIQGGETVEVSMQVESTFTGSHTVWISAGEEETVYISNDQKEILDRVTTWMLPIVGIGTAISIFANILFVVYIKYRRVKTQYTNMFDQI